MIRPSLTTWGTTLALFLAPTDCLFVPPAAVNGSLLKNYDYIVIGGGASGVVLATRLSEDANGKLSPSPSIQSTTQRV